MSLDHLLIKWIEVLPRPKRLILFLIINKEL